MSEAPGPPTPPWPFSAPWPQPPPPPVAGPRAGYPGDDTANPSWTGSQAPGAPGPWWAPPPVAAPRAPGRRPVLAAAIVAVVTAWLLLLASTAILVRAVALPPGIAATPDLARDSLVLVGLAVILAAAVAAGLRAATRWLGNVRLAIGAPSVASLLGPGVPVAVGDEEPAIRRSAVGLAWGTAGALAAAGCGLVAWLGADDPPVARAGIVLVVTGSGAMVVVLGLVPGVLRGIERRERLAAPPDATGRRATLPPRRSPLPGVVAGACAVLLVAVAGMAAEPARMAVACAASEGWTCAEVVVPAIPGDTRSRADAVAVAYAVRPADAPDPGGARRVLVIAVGGPGSSGITEAEWYAGSLPSKVLRAYDLVLFDARGVGSSDARTCPDAYARYEQGETPATARTFAAACIAEAGATGLDLRRYGTAAVVEDLEAIRRRLGVESLALYGSSYGTVVTQAYAAAHPERVTALVLDAPLDRRLTGVEVWQEAALGFAEVLHQTFRACDEDGACHARLADPPAAWDRLARRLATAGRLAARLPDEAGTPTTVEVDERTVLAAVRSALYESAGRASLLRALAASDRGDDRLLVRLVESGGDPTWWPEAFAYYATWCADSRVSATGRADDTGAFGGPLGGRAAEAPGAQDVVRTLLPCLFWPAQPELGALPADPAGVPTLIVSATADPITPNMEARRLYARIDGAHLIEVDGGGHVSLGNGSPCVDDPVADFIVEGRAPAAAVTRCESWVADRFVPPTPYGTRPLDVPWSIAIELLNDPDYGYWDGDGVLVVPCLTSGVARISGHGLGSGDGEGADRVTLDGCAMHPGDPPADGEGTLDWYASSASLRIATARGALVFALEDGHASASGTWDGASYSYRE